jgi:hypothetical protein
VRVAFLCEPNWSAHSVYEGLSKELHKHNIDTHIYHYSWSHKENKNVYTHSIKEWSRIINNFDYFVAPVGPGYIDMFNEIGLPPEKTILCVHATWEIPQMHQKYGNSCLDNFSAVVSVSRSCIKNANQLGIETNIEYVQNGVIFNRFNIPPSQHCGRTGYAYPINTLHTWKRAHIVSKIDGGTFCLKTTYHYSLMRQFYEKIDVSLCVSTEAEACGLINMEAAAAGRLVMSTDVGIVKDSPDTPILKLRMSEEETIEDINHNLNLYNQSPKLHHHKCIEIQEYAREYYDWSYAVKSWLSVLGKLNILD